MPITVTDEELRKGGFSADARNYPRSPRQLAMMAAWTNCTIDELPKAAHFFPNANVRDAWERVEKAAQHYHNHNPPTVNVGLVWVGDEFSGGILVGRRALPGFGYGKLALIGGYQEKGESSEEAVNREVFEETGIQLDVSRWQPHGGPVSVENGSKNIQFWFYSFRSVEGERVARNDIDISKFVPNNELSELMVWHPKAGDDHVAHIELNTDWAFDSHLKMAHHYYFATLR